VTCAGRDPGHHPIVLSFDGDSTDAIRHLATRSTTGHARPEGCEVGCPAAPIYCATVMTVLPLAWPPAM
jgi:hypothetical protein